MYNKERKEEFIRDIMRSRVIKKTTLTGVFKRVEYFEEQFQKDCCQFNREEAIEMFHGLKCKSKLCILLELDPRNNN